MKGEPDSQVAAFPDRDPGLPRFAVALVGGCLVLAVRLALVPITPPRLPTPGAAILEGESPAGLEADPKALFIRHSCAACHALEAESVLSGPSVASIQAGGGRRFEAEGYAGEATAADGYLREAILDHCLDTLPGHTCPQLPNLALQLSVPDLDLLVAFLRPAEAGAAEASP